MFPNQQYGQGGPQQYNPGAQYGQSTQQPHPGTQFGAQQYNPGAQFAQHNPGAQFGAQQYNPGAQYAAGAQYASSAPQYTSGAQFGASAQQYNPASQFGASQPSGNFSNNGVSPEVQQWFNAVDADRSGKINAKELQAALVNGQGKNFPEGVCRLMINMFDKDRTGTIEVREFQDLYQYINNWINVFRTYDRDGSGYIEERELSAALQQMGFRFSSEFLKVVLAKNDIENRSRITVDQFIAFSVQLQRFTDNFRGKDVEQKGTITLGFEEFLNFVISCLP